MFLLRQWKYSPQMWKNAEMSATYCLLKNHLLFTGTMIYWSWKHSTRSTVVHEKAMFSAYWITSVLQLHQIFGLVLVGTHIEFPYFSLHWKDYLLACVFCTLKRDNGFCALNFIITKPFSFIVKTKKTKKAQYKQFGTKKKIINNHNCWCNKIIWFG